MTPSNVIVKKRRNELPGFPIRPGLASVRHLVLLPLKDNQVIQQAESPRGHYWLTYADAPGSSFTVVMWYLFPNFNCA